MTSPTHDDRSSHGSLLQVTGLHIESVGSAGSHTIVRDLDMTVGHGETVGIVGESGSGKSMTARAIIRLLPAGVRAYGSVRFEGHELLRAGERELATIRGSRISMILQDPFTMLNPLLRAGEHIEEMLVDEHGRRPPSPARRSETMRRLAEVGIRDPDVADRYPFQLSGGMRQRVALAASLARDPGLLIADEPSTALDVTTQAEIVELLHSVQRSRGMGLIFISHDLRLAFSVCDRMLVLYAGSILETGPTTELDAEPLHPYTLGLLLSEPPADRRLASLTIIEGSAGQADAQAGCPFQPRCRWAAEVCREHEPVLVTLAPGQASACIRIGQIRPELRSLRAQAAIAGDQVTLESAATPLLRVQGLSKTFDLGHGRRVEAVRTVSLDVGPGESVGLVGESGSGKTTLGRCLVGLETPDAGTIVVDGIDASSFQRAGRTGRGRLRRTIQMIFQDPYSSLDPTQSVGACLMEALGLGAATRREARRQVPELLGRVGLPAAYAGRRPAALSGGERQRVAIARALAIGPQILVCDEPVSSLDVSVQAQILQLFRALRDELGLSYLFITHDLAVVRQIVDRVYVMYGGEIVESGPTDRVLDRPEHAYTRRLLASRPGARRLDA